MAPLEVKSDSRSKQRRTVINNIAQVSHQLRRTPELLISYLAGKATTGICDHSSGQPIWYLKGHYDRAPLQARVSEFCQELVVCPRCGDCGTRLYATVRGSKKRQERQILIHCGACGGCEELPKVAPKLAKLIPELEKKSSKPSRKRRNSKDKSKKKDKPVQVEEDSDEDIEWVTDTSDSAVAARREESISESMASMMSVTNANATAAPDISSTSVHQQDAQPDAQPAPTAGGLSTAAQSAGAPTAGGLSTAAQSAGAPRGGLSTAAQSAKQQLDQAFEGLSKGKQITAAMEALCPLAAELSPVEMLALVAQLPVNAARHCSLVLKVLYDHDVVDEQTITKWHQSADQTLLSVSKAKAFVDWLASTEEQDE